MPGPERPPVATVSRPLLQGRQPVAGLWFPAEGHGESARARCLLAAWRPGSSAWRFAEGDLLRYPAAVWQACDALAGWPLRREGEGLCSAFLTEAERRLLPAADLWLVWGGELLALHLAQARPLDPADWLDLSGPALHDTYDCRAALPPPVILVPPARTVREVLGAAVPPRRGTVLPKRWRDWLARSAAASPPPPLPFRTWMRQTTYLSRLLRMFEEGRLDEALRHALPLGSGDAASLADLAFGVPAPRADLGLTRHPRGATGGLGVIAELEIHLRRLYRKAFEQLDREGRVDEAVFVLAELLQARREALDYLEAHQRLAQAAELALAWDQPAELIVRLHCLAGDWSRAVAVARRDGAFANAVRQMEKQWPDAARRLRGEWGEALAQQGDWLGAVNAVWPVEALQARAQHWLQVAESDEGELGARALVQRALLLPDTMDRHAVRLQALRDERARHGERAALAKALLAATGHGKASRALAGAVAGAVLADHAQAQGRLDKKALQDLVTLGGDPMLQADLPGVDWPAARQRCVPLHEDRLAGEAPAPGTQALLDAVPLADRHHLVALGEAGALIVDAAGRPVARFGVPAQRLVIAHNRQQALALARRDGMWHVSRLDLVQRRATDLGVCELDHFADHFDGLGWTVARGSQLLVLDTGRGLQDVLWQVPDLPGPVEALSTSTEVDRVVAGGELWTYRLPRRRLASRDALPEATESWQRLLLNPQCGAVTLDMHTDERLVLPVWVHVAGGRAEIFTPQVPAQEVQACTAGDWLVLAWRDSGPPPMGPPIGGAETAVGRWVNWFHLRAHTQYLMPQATVFWPEDGALRLRASGSQWLVFDDRGRLLHLDTATREVLRLAVQ